MSLPIFVSDGLDAVIEEYAKGNAVNLPALAYFDFRDAPIGVWAGEYDFTVGGVNWRGLGAPQHVISVTGIEQAATLDAAQMMFTLSGVDAAVMAIASSEDRADYVGRLVGAAGIFMDADWQPLSQPMALAAGIMGTMSVTRQHSDEKWTRSISLAADNILFGRSGNSASFFSDRDQKVRFPGDRGLEDIVGLLDRVIEVPWRNV